MLFNAVFTLILRITILLWVLVISSDTNAAFAGTSSSNGALGEGSEGWGRLLGVIG